MHDYNVVGDHVLNININTPENITVVSRSRKTLNVSVEKNCDVELDVIVKPVQFNLSQDFEFKELTPKVEKVKVSGSQSIIESVKGAQVFLKLGDITHERDIYASDVIVFTSNSAIATF